MICTLSEIIDIFTSHFVSTSDGWKFFDTRMCESNVIKLNDWQAEFQRSKLFWNILLTNIWHFESTKSFFGSPSKIYLTIVDLFGESGGQVLFDSVDFLVHTEQLQVQVRMVQNGSGWGLVHTFEKTLSLFLIFSSQKKIRLLMQS